MIRNTLATPLMSAPKLALTPMAAALAASLFSLTIPNTAMAATLSVGVNGCTLASAIDNANGDTDTDGGAGCIGGSGADAITLPAGVTQTLMAPLPDITSEITIDGNGATVVRDAGAPPFRIFTVTQSADLSLNRTTVSGGFVSGDLCREACAGGILNKGRVTLTQSEISGNTASQNGGGVINELGAVMDLVESTVSANRARYIGAIANYGVLASVNSTISNNIAQVDAGVFTYGPASTVSLLNSTISGNTAEGVGGGLVNFRGRVVLTDSTVSANRTGTFAAGVFNFYGSLALVRSLVSGNSAADNSRGEIFNDRGSVTANNHNLFGFDGDVGVFGFTPGATDVVPNVPVASILAPLANNGGQTQTHALVDGGPAIDTAGTVCSITDQRFVARPQGAACDIDAFETALVTALTLAPVNASRLTLQTQCVTATASSAVGEGVADVAVDFTRTGANPGTQTGVTNGTGQAQHCWSGVNGGVDRVTASFEALVSNESLITWNKRVTSIAPAAVVGVFIPSQRLIRIAPKATLRDTNGNVPIAGRTVQFTAGSAVLCEAVTNPIGVATCNATLSSTLQSILALGYTATFTGDTSYRPVQKKSPLVQIRLGL